MNRTTRRRTLGTAAAGTALAGLVFVGACGVATAQVTPAAARGGPAASAPMHMPMQTSADSIGKYDPQNQGDAMFFATEMRGSNEVPSKEQPNGGDKSGSGTSLVRIQGDQVSYAFTWTGIGTPTAGHIHQGPAGVNGDVKIPFFASKLPDGRNSVIGTVTVTDANLLASIKSHPEQFYVNLHTKDFPGGAVRGQLHALPVQVDLRSAISHDENHPVVEGDQIYTCTRQDSDGSFTFTPDNVNTLLSGGIEHTFVKPGKSGPPQWVAPDKSAVTGRIVTTITGSPGDIPELVLAAKQEGASQGELSGTRAVLRLDTIGGVAPAGTCDPMTQAVTAVPYSADYLFINSK
ncbi:CHRD domain-containing protein [Pseudonocardia xinjiangensis]|uniref:CHRD domain-containing protein n=1 Tax=Pseudonocardia xinjiangensis TaxID=75289 RepID=UPI003D8FE06A